MTELQEKEFELLKCFFAICEKLNLEYYLICGTALGAVKYNGFIPWDDDVDVGLMRPDYERFLKEAPALLPEDFFLQTAQTDAAFPQLYCKLRNSNTTYIEKTDAALPINHGIYMDIFPLDGYPGGKTRQKLFEIRKEAYRFQLSVVFDMPRYFHVKLATKALRLLGFHKRTAKTVARLNRLLMRYPPENSKLICNHGNWQGKLEYAPREQYGNGVLAEFEGLKVRIPEKYDEYLTQKYGDWRLDLPIEQRVGHHDYTVCDCNTPYTAYIATKAET